MNTVARKPLQASLLTRYWRNDNKKVRHIERKRNIPRLKWEVYARQFFGEILHSYYKAHNADAF